MAPEAPTATTTRFCAATPRSVVRQPLACTTKDAPPSRDVRMPPRDPTAITSSPPSEAILQGAIG